MMVRAASLFHRYGLAWILGALWLFWWVVQWFTHDGPTSQFWNATAENLQSEYQQLFTMVVLTAYAIYQGSPQSKDGADKMQADIDIMRKQLARMEMTLDRLREQNMNTPGK